MQSLARLPDGELAAEPCGINGVAGQHAGCDLSGKLGSAGCLALKRFLRYGRRNRLTEPGSKRALDAGKDLRGPSRKHFAG